MDKNKAKEHGKKQILFNANKRNKVTSNDRKPYICCYESEYL